MKRIIIKLTILIIFGCFVPINSYSQVNMERFIEFKCMRGTQVNITIAADSMDTKALIKIGYSQIPVTMPTTLAFARTYFVSATDTIIRIYGDVTRIMFLKTSGLVSDFNLDSNTYITEIWANGLNLFNVNFNNSTNLKILSLVYCQINNIEVSNLDKLLFLDVGGNEELTRLDLRGLTKLQSLSFDNTGVSEVRIDGLKDLMEVYCYDANLSSMGYDSLFCALPEYFDDEYGFIVVVYDSTRPDYQRYLASNSQNAISKRWFPHDRNYEPIPTTYGTFDCSSIGMDDVEFNFVEAKVYPNPAIDYLSIETKEMVQRLEVYDALGRKAISKAPNQNNFSLDISNLEKGIYILKLQTNEGIGSYKIVKN